MLDNICSLGQNGKLLYPPSFRKEAMQATLQIVPMPGKMVRDKGYSHNDLLVVSFRDGNSPEDAEIEVAVETLSMAATRTGCLIQLSLPAHSLRRTSSDLKLKENIGDPRIKRAIGMLLGSDAADTLCQRANTDLGWETCVDIPLEAGVIEAQQAILLWLDDQSRELKAPKLAEFTSRTDWTVE